MSFKGFLGQAGKDLWGSLGGTSPGTTMAEKAIVNVLDWVLSTTAGTLTMDSTILANNMASTYKSTYGSYALNSLNVFTVPLYNYLINNNIDSSKHKVGSALVTGTGKATKVLERSFIEPNISGVPISASRITTSREVEISESMVIVQSSAQKQYWTDNSVPRLKEWSIEGYITAASPIDQGFAIKPSLSLQSYYLDVCAKSRRPVIFKTNRGEFVRVQITNLQTEETSEYNNAIKVTISVKEYNPYFITDTRGDDLMAVIVGAA